MTFEQIWEASRYNGAFWLSHLLGLGGIALLSVIAARVRSKAKRWVGYAVVLMAMMTLITGMTIQSVQLKWKTRWAAAQTADQQQAASRDGANLAFSPIIGGFKALLYMGVGTATLLVIRKKKRSGKRSEAIVADSAPPPEA